MLCRLATSLVGSSLQSMADKAIILEKETRLVTGDPSIFFIHFYNYLILFLYPNICIMDIYLRENVFKVKLEINKTFLIYFKLF